MIIHVCIASIFPAQFTDLETYCRHFEVYLEVSGFGFGCNRLVRFVVGFMMILSAAARIGFDRLIRFEIGLVASVSSCAARAAFLLALAVSELSTVVVVVVIAIVTVFPCR